MSRHLRRLNPSKSRKPQKHDVVSESCVWGAFGFPANPEPATVMAEAKETEQKKRAVA